MSLPQQEQVMLALLFDQDFRAEFCSNDIKALAAFDLSDAEKQDFLGIKKAGLVFDAQLRIDLILSNMIRYFPLTFTLLSSFDNAIESVKTIINVDYIQQSPDNRAVFFASQLANRLTKCRYLSQQDCDACIAIFHGEQQRAILTQQLHGLENPPVQTAAIQLAYAWQQQRIKLADYVSAVLLPMPHEVLKQALQIEPLCNLWQRIKQQPLTVSARQQLWQKLDQRVFITKAYVSYQSPCERVIDFTTAEVSEGFASLFLYINGSYTVAYILEQLLHAGASPNMLASIEGSFKKLLEDGFFELISQECA